MSINVVLFEPEIPQNTGNIARTCACTGATLHLVEPMGFRLTKHFVGRSGMDYWDRVNVVRWSCTKEFLEAHGHDDLHLFTSHTTHVYSEATYADDTYLIFGRESRGIDTDILTTYQSSCVRIPMAEGNRSLNLSNSVAIGVYEVLRGSAFKGIS
ncbi:MAG: tRNA (cytidine(34)-2'-O)-methyltransferase [Eggerthellaceae bacterium]|mgnify:CR=1 FL=1|jgi:tRNA (cytidine/uridine-2'-O-)-methyltransferase|nr:tRNA (cytidine(34)-2'-O)-methyltransferase [Eggerthellaceae bacterium]MCH4220752.1 tRNA (cytidine(34)-2'-O)-methyltransferase [Eggerthellaceae bacterium]